MSKGKTELVHIRLPEHIDKEIQAFAKAHFTNENFVTGNYSEAARFLLELGIIISKRLDNETLKDMM